jgi:shikimate kinase
LRNIVLCGFMGSGKTTVGKALAARLGLQFVDMDAYIENKAGTSVSELFQKRGEPYFRQLESRAAKALTSRSGLVIATGGGAVLNKKNVLTFKSGGVIVYLDVPPEVIINRLAGDQTRPLLNQPDRDSALLELYRKRQPLYRAAADIVVRNTDNIPAARMAERVAEAITACKDGSL